jgi:hypothetical protein
MARSSTGKKASRANPTLEALSFLVGKWPAICTHSRRPGHTLRCTTTFEWVEGGAFLCMRSQADDPDMADAVAYFATSAELGEITICWIDERRVSHLRPVTVQGRSISWTLEDPALMQRVTITVDGVCRMTISDRKTKPQVGLY